MQLWYIVGIVNASTLAFFYSRKFATKNGRMRSIYRVNPKERTANISMFGKRLSDGVFLQEGLDFLDYMGRPRRR